MPKPIKFNRILYGFTTLVIINLLLLFSSSSIAYVNSSFLSKFFNSEFVSFLFVLRAFAAILILYSIPFILSKIEIRSLLIVIIPVLQLTLIFLGFSKNGIQAAMFFILQSLLTFIIVYILDLYVEKSTIDETKTGSTRAIFLTSGNIAVLIAPLLIGLFVINNYYPPLYTFTAIILAPIFFFALTTLKHITPKLPEARSFKKTIDYLLCCNPSVLYVIGATLLLNMLYAWLVIYAPLLLIQVGGYSWQTIGLITAFAILPYVFLEMPLGILADKYFGETEIMSLGFLIIGLSLVAVAFIPLSFILLWAFVFFLVRVGGSMVEITTETYFFKQVDEKDSTMISIFRMVRSLGFLIAPLIAIIFLPVTNLQIIFAVFGAIMLIGVPLALRIWDTK